MPQSLTQQQWARKRAQARALLPTFMPESALNPSANANDINKMFSGQGNTYPIPSYPLKMDAIIPAQTPPLVFHPQMITHPEPTPPRRTVPSPRSHPSHQTPIVPRSQPAPMSAKPSSGMSSKSNVPARKPSMPTVSTPTILGLPASPNASYGAGQPLPYPVRNFVPHPTANPFSSLLPNGYAPSSLSLYGPSNRPSAPAPPPSTTQMPPVAHPSYGAGQPLPYPQHQMGMSATPHLNPFERAVQAGRTLVQRGRDAIDDYVDYQHSPNGGPAQYHRLSDDLNSPAYNPKSVTIGGHMVNGHWVGGHKIGLADNGFNLGKTASMMLDGTVQAPLFIWNANQHSLNTRKDLGLATINALAGHQKAAAQHWHNMQQSGQQSADDSGQIIKGFTNDFLGGGEDLRNAIAAYKSGDTAAGNTILKQFGPDVYKYVQTHKLETALTVVPHLIGGLKFGARKIAPRLLTAAENNRQLAVTRGKSGDTVGANQAADLSAMTRTVGTKLQQFGGVKTPKATSNASTPLTKDSSWLAHMSDANQKMKRSGQSIQGVETPSAPKLTVKSHSNTTSSDIGKPTTTDINGHPVVAPLSKDSSWPDLLSEERERSRQRIYQNSTGKDNSYSSNSDSSGQPSSYYHNYDDISVIKMDDGLYRAYFKQLGLSSQPNPGHMTQSGMKRMLEYINNDIKSAKGQPKFQKGYSEYLTQNAINLRDSLAQALKTKRLGAIVLPSRLTRDQIGPSLSHESLHEGQTILGNGDSDLALPPRPEGKGKWRLEKHPAYPMAYFKLLMVDPNYEGQGLTEIPATIAGGEYASRLGLAEKDAWEIMKAYTTDLIEQHGVKKVARVFRHSHQLTKAAADSVIEHFSKPENRRTLLDKLRGTNPYTVPPIPYPDALTDYFRLPPSAPKELEDLFEEKKIFE